MRRPEIRFGRRFLLGCLVVAFVYDANPWLLSLARTATASAAAGASTLVGLHASRAGTIVLIDGGVVSYDITDGCTAAFIGLLFIAAIVAYPSRWRPKLTAVAAGIPLLVACNVARLVSMGWAGVNFPWIYEDLHMVYWQILLVLFVGVGFYAWTRSLDRERGAAAPWLRRARRLALASAIFVGCLWALWTLGAWAGGIPLYARGVFFVVQVMQRALWGYAAAPRLSTWTNAFVWDYAATITLISLFAASIHVPIRQRAKGLFLWALPTTVLIQATLWALALRSRGFLSHFESAFLATSR